MDPVVATTSRNGVHPEQMPGMDAMGSTRSQNMGEAPQDGSAEQRLLTDASEGGEI